MRRSRHISIIVTILLVIVGCSFLLIGVWRTPRSLEKQLAEIEAARAIPDTENAAMIYNTLMADPNNTPEMEGLPTSSDEQAFNQVLCEPWSTQDHPELAAWVEKQRFIIDRLTEASRFEKCRFPVSLDAYDANDFDRVSTMVQWAQLVSLAANNDIADGQVDAATKEWQCSMQLTNHCRQQPLLWSHAMANYVDGFVWRPIARFVVDGNPTEAQLRAIETLPQPLTDHWAEYLREIRAVDDLQKQKLLQEYSPLARVKSRLGSYLDHLTGRGADLYDKTAEMYLSSVVMGRSIRIFVALRRYRNATGRWPENLDEVKPSLPDEVLMDPFNKCPLVYRLQGDSFRLYSTGWNRRDESSQQESEAGDDWPLWPLPPMKSEPEQQKHDGE